MLRLLAMFATLMVLCGCAGSAGPRANEQAFQRPVATYSIVARDPRSGEIGVAVQSHWFSVGSVVPWAQAGVGAVATQSLVDPSYGPLGLEMMALGREAPAALAGVMASDEGREVRQVAMIDARGKVAAHTGKRCIAHAGHLVDEEKQFSVQANLMEHRTVWDAMAEAYRAAPGNADLAERLLLALEAAENEGGDIRGRQSAAILIVRAESTGLSWKDRLFDLRVEDHPEPVKELRRLVQVQRAYNHMNAGDEAIEKEDFEKASREYAAAAGYAPQMVEIPFWHAVALVSAGKVEQSLPIFHEVFAKEPKWVDVVDRLADVEIIPKDQKVLEAIHRQAPRRN